MIKDLIIIMGIRITNHLIVNNKTDIINFRIKAFLIIKW